MSPFSFFVGSCSISPFIVCLLPVKTCHRQAPQHTAPAETPHRFMPYVLMIKASVAVCCGTAGEELVAPANRGGANLEASGASRRYSSRDHGNFRCTDASLPSARNSARPAFTHLSPPRPFSASTFPRLSVLLELNYSFCAFKMSDDGYGGGGGGDDYDYDGPG